MKRLSLFTLFILALALVLLPSYSSAQCITTFPYVEDFEAGPAGWTSGPMFPGPGSQNTWAFGDPVKTFINSAPSGDSCWVVGGLSGNYAANELSYIQSPCFDLSGMANPILGLSLWTECADLDDGATVIVSIDSGLTWAPIMGADSNYNPWRLWYRQKDVPAISTGLGIPAGVAGWSGSRASFQFVPEHAQLDLIGLGGQQKVMLRVLFGSDATAQDEGFAFDDFVVLEKPDPFLGNDTTVCAPITLSPANAPPPGPNVSYTWWNGATTPTITVNTSGFYGLEINYNGISVADTILVTVNPGPLLALGPDQTFCDTLIVQMPWPTFPMGSTFQLNIYDSTQMAFVNTNLQVGGSLMIDTTSIFEGILIDNGCESRDTIVLTRTYIGGQFLGRDTSVCAPFVYVTPILGGPGLQIQYNQYDPSLMMFVPLATGPAFTILNTTLVEMVLTTSGGCVGRDTALFTIIKSPDASLAITVPIICSGGTGIIECQIGGMPNNANYNYNWSNGSTFPTQFGLLAGTYSVNVYDPITNCDTTLTIALTEPNPTTTTGSVTPDFGNSDGTATFAHTGGTAPHTFTWTPMVGQASGSTITGLDAGAYQLIISDGAGCPSRFNFTIPYATAVFPGDCNHDQVANLQDLLPIGVKHGSTGAVRPNASLAWTPQVAPLWGDTLVGGLDISHVDTDGNGTINNDDTLAINLNFGQTHNNLRGTAASGIPLSFLMPTMNLNAGDTIIVPIELGTIDTPAVNLYGIAFSIMYDTSKVEENGFTLDFSNSWLGTSGTDMLTMYRDDYAAGRVDIGLVRTNQINQTGFGAIANAIIVIDDHVAKRDVPFSLDFADIFAIEANEVEILVKGLPGVATISTGFSTFSENSILVYPNPAKDFVEISHVGVTHGQVRILDLQGREVLNTKVNPSGKTQIQLDAFAKGIYLLQVESEGRVFVEKVSVQ